MKFKTYNGESLNNAHVSLKIDGVRCWKDNGRVLSRKGKPLYGINPDWMKSGLWYEVYCGSFKETIQIVRAQKGAMVDPSHLYCLHPIDKRLYVNFYPELEPEVVEKLLLWAFSKDCEGLIISATEGDYKVKAQETMDVKVTDIFPGKGKYVGKLGAFMTPMGKVGTGLTDKEREEFNKESMIGELIEVGYMELTEDGKFRHPRFIRHRWDR